MRGRESEMRDGRDVRRVKTVEGCVSVRERMSEESGVGFECRELALVMVGEEVRVRRVNQSDGEERVSGYALV